MVRSNARRGNARSDESGQQDEEPAFVISVAARMVGMHAQTLRYYERAGLIRPSRSRGNIRLYSQSDINRMRHIQRLINDLGVNLAGAEVIIRMSERIGQLEEQNAALQREVQRLRDRRLPAPMNP